MTTEQEIKKLAYDLWEHEGWPEGKHLHHYFTAKQILEDREAVQVQGGVTQAVMPTPARPRSPRTKKR
ncbi:MAG: DUF2934 domain-containing protein [Chloroflexi bacterium]|nr:DUF2934 domain-containing protein [Chloroflexota bacterium]